MHGRLCDCTQRCCLRTTLRPHADGYSRCVLRQGRCVRAVAQTLEHGIGVDCGLCRGTAVPTGAACPRCGHTRRGRVLSAIPARITQGRVATWDRAELCVRGCGCCGAGGVPGCCGVWSTQGPVACWIRACCGVRCVDGHVRGGCCCGSVAAGNAVTAVHAVMGPTGKANAVSAVASMPSYDSPAIPAGASQHTCKTSCNTFVRSLGAAYMV